MLALLLFEVILRKGSKVMAQVYLSLGSNCQREQHLSNALDRLNERFGELVVSPVYQSSATTLADAQGSPIADYYNLVVGLICDISPCELVNWNRQLEACEDRRRPDNGRVTLDVDLLLYDNLCMSEGEIVLPGADILTRAYVLRPLADIAGAHCYPATENTYQTLWEHFAKKPLLTPVDFVWGERVISTAAIGLML